MPVHTLHSFFLFAWFGILMAEGIVELLPLVRPEFRQAGDTIHYYIDLFFETPLLVGIVGTGAWLLRGVEVDTGLAVKLAGAALAIGANFACIGVVVARHHGSPEARARRSRQVLWCVGVGSPGGIVALIAGAVRAGWIGG